MTAVRVGSLLQHREVSSWIILVLSIQHADEQSECYEILWNERKGFISSVQVSDYVVLK